MLDGPEVSTFKFIFNVQSYWRRDKIHVVFCSRCQRARRSAAAPGNQPLTPSAACATRAPYARDRACEALAVRHTRQGSSLSSALRMCVATRYSNVFEDVSNNFKVLISVELLTVVNIGNRHLSKNSEIRVLTGVGSKLIDSCQYRKSPPVEKLRNKSSDWCRVQIN